MTQTHPEHRKALLMKQIEQRLSALTHEQQNYIAYYALGLRDGLRLCNQPTRAAGDGSPSSP